jgi:hypothetical protein
MAAHETVFDPRAQWHSAHFGLPQDVSATILVVTGT